MTLNPHELLRRKPAEDATFRAPLRGARSQAMQRLQVGLFGLAAMVLLVGLANIIMTNAKQNEARVVPAAVPAVASHDGDGSASDPLADAGVVPGMPAAGPEDAATGEGDASPPGQP